MEMKGGSIFADSTFADLSKYGISVYGCCFERMPSDKRKSRKQQTLANCSSSFDPVYCVAGCYVRRFTFVNLFAWLEPNRQTDPRVDEFDP